MSRSQVKRWEWGCEPTAPQTPKLDEEMVVGSRADLRAEALTCPFEVGNLELEGDLSPPAMGLSWKVLEL